MVLNTWHSIIHHPTRATISVILFEGPRHPTATGAQGIFHGFSGTNDGHAADSPAEFDAWSAADVTRVVPWMADPQLGMTVTPMSIIMASLTQINEPNEPISG